MKRVLIITCHWPPSGGGSVLRWLKFCKYLREFGWEPIVYTPENPDVDFVDKSLELDVRPEQVVVRLPIPEPNPIYGMPAGISDQTLRLDPGQRSWKRKVFAWIHSNLMVPDKLASWIEPSIEFLTEYLKHEPVDAVVSTGPPHSMHLIAQAVKRNLNLPWIADFRDPWTNVVYYERLPLTRWADRRHKQLEQSVIEDADILVEAAPSWAARLRLSGGTRVETITNGYDPEEMPKARVLSTDKFRINHSGVLTADRNHQAFWEALRAISKGVIGFQNNVEIELVGKVDPSVTQMANYYGFSSNLVQPGQLSHSNTLDRMASAQVLLLPIDRAVRGAGFIPGRIFEYMASGRPILLIGSAQGEAARIIQETKTGMVASYDDFHGLKTIISDWYEMHKKGLLKLDSTGIEAYSGRTLTEKLATLLNEITETPPDSHSPESKEPSSFRSEAPNTFGVRREATEGAKPGANLEPGDPDQDNT